MSSVPQLPPVEMSDEDERALKTRISQARTRLMVHCPFFGVLALKLNPKIVGTGHSVKTAAVTPDGNGFFNVNFCATLTDKQLAGLLVHEVLHPAFQCFERGVNRNVMVMTSGGQIVSLWNVAHDYAINLMIDMFDCPDIELPPDGLLDKKYKNWAAEEVYDTLSDQMSKDEDGRVGPFGKPNKSGEEGEEGEGQPLWGVDDMRADLGEDGCKLGTPISDAKKRELERYWKVAVAEAAQIHRQTKGDLPGAMEKIVGELIDPTQPWEDVLSQWMGEHGRKEDYTYSRPARRSLSVFPDGNSFMPSLEKEGVDDMVILWDTSGSMNGREKVILSEVIGICEDMNMSLRVICVDTAVHSDQHDVREPEDVDVKGGGGSDFRPGFELLDEEGYKGVVVAFTDGYIDVPEVKPTHLRDCLWVIGEHDVDPARGKWGSVLKMNQGA